tara:strand:- start:3058 stop:3750 length:693 start_codon:yes stop_codon:yes gene_type:complete
MKKYKKKFDIFKILIEKQDPVIVEIGAHYGEDSVRFTEVFDNATIYCFEPDPRNIDIFKKHISDPRIKLFEYALSNEEGTAEFYQSYQDYELDEIPEKYSWIDIEDYKNNKLNNSGSSSLKKGYKHTLSQTITVKTRRFDNWYLENKLENVDMVWIDVQGAERIVIEGMGDVISNITFIWIEYGETSYSGAMTRQETISLLKDKNFNLLKDFYNDQNTGDLLFYNTIKSL